MKLQRFHRYDAIFEPSSSGGFGVRFPDVPEAFSYGDSEEDAIKKAREALAFYLYETAAEGKIFEKPSSDKKTVELNATESLRQIDVDMASFYPNLFKERRGGTRPGSGRPKLAPGAPRSGRQASRSLMIRLTDEEFDTLSKKAKASKKTKAEFVRDLLFND